MAVARPENGPTSGAPLTKCRSGTGIGVSRPGRASAAVGIRSFDALNTVIFPSA